MKLHHFLICLFVLLGAAPLAAQSPADSLVEQTILYLRDSSVVRGELLRITRDGEVMLHLENGKLVTYAPREVVRRETTQIRRAPARPTARPTATDTAPPVAPTRITTLDEPAGRPDKPCNLRVDLHTLSGTDKGAGFNLAVGLHAELLRATGREWLFGVGLGWDMYTPSIGEELCPVYATAKYYPEGFGRPAYLFGSAGYGIAFKDQLLEVSIARGGLYLHGGLGLPIFNRSGHHLALELGFVTQEAEFGRINFNDDFEFRDLQFRRITLGARAYIFRRQK